MSFSYENINPIDTPGILPFEVRLTSISICFNLMCVGWGVAGGGGADGAVFYVLAISK